MVAGAAFTLHSAAVAGNVALGKSKSEEAACISCHGADGVKGLDASYPILAGQYEDFISRALTDYKSGRRKNAVMSGMAAALSKQDIENLAAYYASLPGPLGIIKR
jgi:cytochrome c553